MRSDKHKGKKVAITEKTKSVGSRETADINHESKPKERSVRENSDLDMSSGPISSTEERRQKRAKKRQKRRRLGCIIPLVIVICLLAGGAYGANKIYKYVDGKLGKMDYKKINENELQIDEKQAKEIKDFQNIAVLGIDTREGEDDETCRTDAIIMATIDKDKKKVALTSVDRDTYWTVDEVGTLKLDKTNHAHAYGGPKGTMRALNRNADLNVKDFVRVNWKTVADTVDAMGGVVLPVKQYEINEMNKYIRDTNKNLHGDNTPITKAGKQKLNGIQAVTYCRIRKVGNGDTERAERMRRTLQACISKVKTMKFEEIDKMADKILPEITTSLTSKEMISLVLKASRYEIKNSGGFPYVSDGKYLRGVSYTPPITLEKNVKELHKRLFRQKDYKPSKRVMDINSQIIEATGFTGIGYPEPGKVK